MLFVYMRVCMCRVYACVHRVRVCNVDFPDDDNDDACRSAR